MPESVAAIEPTKQFQAYIHWRHQELRGKDVLPATLDEWTTHKRWQLREKLLESWGGFPREACDLAPRKFGEFTREGYRVEKIIFQTRPGVFMTANAYVPDVTGKRWPFSAVHGHWRGAKQDPVPQAQVASVLPSSVSSSWQSPDAFRRPASGGSSKASAGEYPLAKMTAKPPSGRLAFPVGNAGLREHACRRLSTDPPRSSTWAKNYNGILPAARRRRETLNDMPAAALPMNATFQVRRPRLLGGNGYKAISLPRRVCLCLKSFPMR